MTKKPDLEWQKREISATISEVVESERSFKEKHGVDIADEGEWIQLYEFISRIEERLAKKLEIEPKKETAA